MQEYNKEQEKINHFWWFCNEREAIRLKKSYGIKKPWTNDFILDRHKFTNINRVHDRGTKLLIELCNKHTAFDQFCASSIYRFSGSNNSLIAMMQQNKPSNWFKLLGSVTPLFNMSAYQACWPAGKGKGVQFMLSVLELFCKNSFKDFKDNMDIQECVDIMCTHLVALKYKAMRFQSTEVTKDLSIFTTLVNKDSVCPMNVGAIRGLKALFNTASLKNLDKLIHSDQNPKYNTQVLEHALCEYSKYIDYQTGQRTSQQKVYTPTIIRYNTFNNLFIINPTKEA